ncbi:dynein heavy chain 5, axonemal-like, partial [Etheostoma cragini]|uniref:dynein heavy chain 5, axonemal-like n=1 Tax=Etheostoma cragini TaxID=417921 RepID=UPI00155F5416
MLILKKKLDVLKGPEMTKVIRSYNKIAVVLLQYELLHLHGWSQAAESAPHRLSAALLVRRENSKVLDDATIDEWMSELTLTIFTTFSV